MLRRNKIIKKLSKSLINDQKKLKRTIAIRERNRIFHNNLNVKIKENEDMNKMKEDFASYMYKVYLQSEREAKTLENFEKKIEGAFWVNKDAINVVVSEFENCVKEIGFNSKALVMAFEKISKVWEVRGQGGSGSELTGVNLFNNSDFEILVDSFLYALNSDYYIDGHDIAAILDSLTTLGYKSLKLQKSVQRKLSSQDFFKKVNFHPKEKNITELQQIPMAGVKGYALRNRMIDEKTASEAFQTYLNNLQQIDLESYEVQEAAAGDLEDELEEFEFGLNQLSNAVSSSTSDLSQLMTSILKLRKDYEKLTKIQKEDYIMQNSSILTDLLELEELLLEIGVIDVQDLLDISQNKPLDSKSQKVIPILQQFLVENQLPTTLIDHAPYIANRSRANLFEKNAEEITNNNKGIFRDSFIVALESLSRYALLEAEDIRSGRTYKVEGIEKLVDENINEIKFAREKSDFGLADEEDILNDGSKGVNLKELRIARIQYHKSLHEFSRYLEFICLNHIDREYMNDQDSLLRIEAIVKKSLLDLSLTKNQTISVPATAETLGAQYRQSFQTASKNQKIEILLKIAKSQNMDPIFDQIFTELFEENFNSYQNSRAITSLVDQRLFPLPKPIENLILVLVHALNLEIPVHKNYSKFLRKLKIGQNLTLTEMKDNKDPFGNMAKMYIKGAFERENNADLQREIEIAALNFLPEELLPDAYIRTLEGQDLAMYIADPLDCNFSDSVDLQFPQAYDQKFKMLEEFFRLQTENRNLRVFVIPHNCVFEASKTLDRQFKIRGDVMEYLDDIKLSILNLRWGETSEEQAGATGQGLELYSSIPAILGLNTLGNSSSFIEAVRNYSKLYARIMQRKPTMTNITVLQNFLYHINIEFGNLKEENQLKIAEACSKSPDQFTQLLQSVSTELSTLIPQSTQVPFEGRRLGLELIPEKADEVEEIPALEMFNYNFLRDPEFFTYHNWRELIELNYNENVDLGYGRTEAGQFSTIPKGHFAEGNDFAGFLKPSGWSVNWELYAFGDNQHNVELLKSIESTVYNAPTEPKLHLIYNIDRLKHEIKISKDLNQVAERVSKLQFIQNLVEYHLENMEPGLEIKTTYKEDLEMLPRSFNDYVEMKNRQLGVRYEDNEYRNVIKQEVTYLKEAEYWREVVYEKIPLMFEELKKNNKDTKQLKAFRIQAEKNYFKALRALDGRKSDKVTMFSANQIKGKNSKLKISIERILDLTYNESIMIENKYYNVETDSDFLSVSNNEQQFLELKKIKSESSLIKFAIVTKVLRNEALTELELQYLNRWENSILQNKPESILPPVHSSLRFGDLQPEDLLILKNDLKFTYNPEFANFSLNDLTFEISNILNEQFITNFEQALRMKKISNEWGLQAESHILESSGINNFKKFLLDRAEKTQWKKSMRYSEEEIDSIKQIFALGRGSTPYEKAMLEKDLESFDAFIAKINDNDQRDNLLNEWLIRKNREDDKRSRILVKELIKNDDNLEQHFQSFRQKKIDDRLKQIFNVEDPQSIQSEDLGLFCNQISKRFYLFKNSIPSSLACVLYGVINHDNLLENDRMLLENSLSVFGFDVNNFFGNEKLAKIPLYVDNSKNWEFEKYGVNDGVVASFSEADYDVVGIFKDRLDAFGY